jgi:transcriptional regulator with XRE-family HTH domain
MATVPKDGLVTEGDARENQPERLGSLLRQCRARVDPECHSLGPYLRMPARIGKPITQEEVAEAAGVSRQWYALMESDRTLRVSAAVLARIAATLMLDRTDRAAMFRLAVPELRTASLMNNSAEVLDAFESLRRFARTLWTASSEVEALTLVREHTLTQLVPDVVVTPMRVGEGRWVHRGTDEGGRGERFIALLRERCGAAALDDLHGYTLLAQPGELLTSAERDARLPGLATKVRDALRAAEMPDVSVAMANVRSHRGFVARLLAVHRTPHAFTAIERAQLSTLADLTSLALSGS